MTCLLYYPITLFNLGKSGPLALRFFSCAALLIALYTYINACCAQVDVTLLELVELKKTWLKDFVITVLTRSSRKTPTTHDKSYAKPLFFVMVFIAAVLICVMFVSYRPPNYVLMHNVWVEDRTSDYNFIGWVKNPMTGEWQRFVVPGCHDFVPTREIQHGVTLKSLQYVEDRINSCDELDGRYAGYILLRDEYENPIMRRFFSSVTGPSTASITGP